jgi:transposase
MGSGGKQAKKRAIVGAARKLAVLLHTLWVNGQVYEPLYNRHAAEAAKAKAQAKATGKAAA